MAYHNWVTMTLNLTSDLVSRKCIESLCISPIFFEIGIPNLACADPEIFVRGGVQVSLT